MNAFGSVYLECRPLPWIPSVLGEAGCFQEVLVPQGLLCLPSHPKSQAYPVSRGNRLHLREGGEGGGERGDEDAEPYSRFKMFYCHCGCTLVYIHTSVWLCVGWKVLLQNIYKIDKIKYKIKYNKRHIIKYI